MDIIKSIEHEQMKNKIPKLKVGDTVKVHVRVKEGNRERIQVFEGIIIKIQGGGVNQTFTVRRLSYGVGVEKTFLIHSPTVEKVEVTRIGKARRAKLFYLRDRVGKSAKTKEKVGARIETTEVTIKEELAEEPEIVEEEAVSEEAIETPVEVKSEETLVAKESVEVKAEETPTTEEQVVETKPTEETKNDTAKVEEAPEEEPAIKEENPVVEEIVDTVSEEKVETVKDSSDVEETKKEEANTRATESKESTEETKK